VVAKKDPECRNDFCKLNTGYNHNSMSHRCTNFLWWCLKFCQIKKWSTSSL